MKSNSAKVASYKLKRIIRNRNQSEPSNNKPSKKKQVKSVV